MSTKHDGTNCLPSSSSRSTWLGCGGWWLVVGCCVTLTLEVLALPPSSCCGWLAFFVFCRLFIRHGLLTSFCDIISSVKVVTSDVTIVWILARPPHFWLVKYFYIDDTVLFNNNEESVVLHPMQIVAKRILINTPPPTICWKTSARRQTVPALQLAEQSNQIKFINQTKSKHFSHTQASDSPKSKISHQFNDHFIKITCSSSLHPSCSCCIGVLSHHIPITT